VTRDRQVSPAQWHHQRTHHNGSGDDLAGPARLCPSKMCVCVCVYVWVGCVVGLRGKDNAQGSLTALMMTQMNLQRESTLSLVQV
jgi:hypothetical protein